MDNAKRQKRLANKRRRTAVIDKRREYPFIRIQDQGADPAFINLVGQVISDIDLLDESVLPDWLVRFHRTLKKQGVAYAQYEFFKDFPHPKENHIAQVYLTTVLGQVIFNRIPKDVLLNHIPYNDLLILYDGNEIHAYFRGLKTAKGTGGTLYYSRHEPKLTVDGKEYAVAFSDHAIQRTCYRTIGKGRWPTYAGSGDVFAFFDQCLEFELCTLYPDVLAFTFFDECAPGFISHGRARKILADKFRPADKYRYRIGYCPVVIEGRFIKAKTLLFPGCTSTPEYGLILRSRLSYSQREKMIELTRSPDLNDPMDETDKLTSLLKWFHDNGVEQIRTGWPRFAPAWEETTNERTQTCKLD